jgi:winged helix-turn helix protein
MRFKEAYECWHAGQLTQMEAARLLGMCDRSFRRYLARYEEWDMQGLIDKRIEQVSQQRAPVDEVMKRVALYSAQYEGWNVKHFHSWYRREHQSVRSYTWVKNESQAAGAVAKLARGGAHRKRRERAPMVGMMIHQDGSTHEWVAGSLWDLIVTMDDATGEHYSMFFVEQEGAHQHDWCH